MKRCLCFILLFVLLCGCSDKKTVTPKMKGISFNAVIRYYNETYTCFVTVDENCTAEIEMKEPEDISGMKFVCDKDLVTAEFMGLEYTPDFEKLPSGAAVRTIYKILCDANKKDVKIKEKGGNYLLSGKAYEREYELTLAPTGLPITAQIPDESYTVDFRNVKILSTT